MRPDTCSELSGFRDQLLAGHCIKVLIHGFSGKQRNKRKALSVGNVSPVWVLSLAHRLHWFAAHSNGAKMASKNVGAKRKTASDAEVPAHNERGNRAKKAI